MTNVFAPFKADRFASAVPHYVEGRLNYPPRLITDLVAILGLTPGDRVLDLGCGPGFLALAFARLGFPTLGLDPDVAMLAAAREAAASESAACDFHEGSSFDLSPAFGRFKLVAMGRSFHWMDRKATLATLDGMIEEGGAVALFRDHHIDCAENRWDEALDEVRERFEAGGTRGELRQAMKREPHPAVLLASPFARLDIVGLIERRSVPVARVLDRALSYSGSTPAVLGERRAEFEAAVREAVTPFARDGLLDEVVEFTALVARRA